MQLKKILATTAIAAAMTTAPFLAPVAVAQDQPVEGAQIAADTDKVDAFITAALGVNEVREAYIARLQAEEDEEAQTMLLQEADSAMIQVIEDTPDISVDEYIAIADAAAADPELAARIDARFSEAYGG